MWYKKGDQKKNVKCLCKNGQNGDPSWKKSCSWSFNDKPWSVSDVKHVQCKARDRVTTTQSTTQSTTATTIATNPNTHRFCEYFDGWTSECSHCYSYTLETDYFYNDETYKYYYEDYTCEMKISTVCDSNFVDKFGRDCIWHASTTGRCQKYATGEWSVDPIFGVPHHLGAGVMSDEGFVTQYNCPECGCGANGPIFRFDNL